MPRRLFTKEALSVGVLLTALQIGVVCLSSPGNSYAHLCGWDCGWYSEIARDGYHSAVPPVGQRADISNVAFFPAYPLAARGLYLGLGLSPSTGLLVIAQLFAILFWAALWMLLRRWRIPLPLALLAVLAVFSHPAAFYLVSGYSESLFLSSLLIFALCAEKSLTRAGIAGFAMSATRIIGLPASGLPIIHQVSRAMWRRRVPPVNEFRESLLLSAVAAAGAGVFFIYCHLRFGRYDLYLETQRIGWGIMPDYGALWKWEAFKYRFPMDAFVTRASGLAFIFFACLETLLMSFSRASGLSRRIPLYALAFLFFFITLSGLKSVGFMSMIRYSLPWYILLVVCAAHLGSRIRRAPRSIAQAGFVLIAFGLLTLFYLFQLPHLRDFLNGRWFA